MPIFRSGKPRIGVSIEETVVTPGAFGIFFPVPFDQVDMEDPTGWDAETYAYTVDRTGLYVLSGQIEATHSADAGDYGLFRLYAADLPKASSVNITPAGGVVAGCTWLGMLNQGDIIYAIAFLVASSGTWTVPGNEEQSNGGTWMSCTRVGPERWT